MGTFNGANWAEALEAKQRFERTQLGHVPGTAFLATYRLKRLPDLTSTWRDLGTNMGMLATWDDPTQVRAFLLEWAGRFLAVADAITEGGITA